MKKIKKIVALVAALALCLGFGANVYATEGSELLFAGGSNVAYESEDASWLMDAADDDVITLVYTCTDSTHAGWGVLGWGATVDGVWTDGPSHEADATDAGASVHCTMTAKELKTALGIKDDSVVTLIKLGAWNGGKIEGLYISAPDAAPSKEEAKDVDASEITTEDPKKAALPELTGDYLYMFTEPTSFKIYPNAFNSAFIPFRTITITVEMESNADFGGCLGTCVNNWAWSMPTFASDENNQATITWYLTPWLDNIDFQIWWMSGTQLGIKSIKVDTDIDWHALYAQNWLASGGASGGNSGTTNPGTSIYSGSFALDWGTDLQLTADKFAGLSFDGTEKLVISYTSTNTAEWGSQFQLATAQNYTVLGACENLPIASNTTQKIVTLTDEWAAIANDGMLIQGWNGTVTDVTIMKSATVADPNTATASYTFDPTAAQGDKFLFDLNALFPQAEVGDTVDVTLTLSSNGGWFGGGFGYNDETQTWTQQQVDALDTEYTATIPIVWASGTTGQVEQWWIGGAEVTANATFKLNQ